jgi:hypothetical protein
MTHPDCVLLPREPTPEMLRTIVTVARRIKLHPMDFLELYAVIVKAAEMAPLPAPGGVMEGRDG